jgi:prevent-host-death family protein
MERIGVRELRQHASRHLARVAAGETLEITERGRLVARLVPVLEDPWDDLVVQGRLRPAVGDLLEFTPVDAGGADLSRALTELRDDER